MMSNDLIELARQVASVRQAQRDYFAVSSRRGKTAPEAVELADQAKAMERRLDQRLKEIMDAAAPKPSLFEQLAEQGLPD